MKIKFVIISIITVILISSCKKENSTLFSLIPSNETGIDFNNIIKETDSFNILTEEYIFNGGGVAIADFNNDSFPDIFFSGNQVANKLYLNIGNFKFKDASKTSGIEGTNRWSTGVTTVDINNDGLIDIYVCAAIDKNSNKRRNQLFINQGLDKNNVPIFKDMAKAYGIDSKDNSMGAIFFDYDKDGYLDLYVLNNEQNNFTPTSYRKKITDGTAISNDKLYRNNQNNAFTDVTKEAGILIEGFGLGIGVADINKDSWPDIYVTNDYITNDILYINNQDGTFSNQIEKYIGHQSKFSMGCDIADYDNDGNLDIVTLDMLGDSNYRMKTTIGDKNYIVNILDKRWNYEPQHIRNMIHKGNGSNLPFSEIGLMATMFKTDWSWSPLFMDANNNGYKDLFITNGFPRDITDKDFADFRLHASPFYSTKQILDSIPVIKVPNYSFINNGDWTFKDSSKEWGINQKSFSNGAAYADLDNDGDLDYVVNNINDKAFLFRNTFNKSRNHNFLKVKLEGSITNRLGIGAKIVLRQLDNSFQYYEHFLTRGYMSSMDHIIHFGLGENKNLKAIEIYWPDGAYQKKNMILSNTTLTFKHNEASIPDKKQLSFPLVPKDEQNPQFIEVSKKLGINYTHEEQDVIDFNIQYTLPHKLSQNGPCLAGGDLNGDGLQDFIIGSAANYSPAIYFQTKKGTFNKEILYNDQSLTKYEETAIEVFDIDNDEDMDIYLATGSYEFYGRENLYKDIILINDGRGKFIVDTTRLSSTTINTAVAKAIDFNKDGYTDLFIGGSTKPGAYPLPENSFLLMNKNGILTDVTKEYAPELQNIGIITDATWTDINHDNLEDLVVVGEYMPITIFENTSKGFQKIENTGLADYLGWWKCIMPCDMDLDGDTDFIVGNIGENNFFHPTKTYPLTLIAKDFDNNGSIEPLLFSYFKNNQGELEQYPVSFWGDLTKLSPIFRKKFKLYKEYGQANFQTMFKPEELDNIISLQVNYDKSCYIENKGNFNFTIHPLPKQAQIAPINKIIEASNPQNRLLIGNDYGNETFVGKYDAFIGLNLVFNPNNTSLFSSIDPLKSGFIVPNDAKDILKIKSAIDNTYIYVVSQNRNKILVFKKNKPYTRDYD